MRQKQRVFSLFLLSPSSRRAWIEISGHLLQISGSLSSPSSRRAWIEILVGVVGDLGSPVALLTEGVDRNSRWCCV